MLDKPISIEKIREILSDLYVFYLKYINEEPDSKLLRGQFISEYNSLKEKHNTSFCSEIILQLKELIEYEKVKGEIIYSQEEVKNIFKDGYSFAKKYIDKEFDDDVWTNVINEASSINKKYNKPLSVKMYVSILEVFDKKEKEMNKEKVFQVSR